MSRVHFYATRNDILMVCDFVEPKFDLKIIPSFYIPASKLKMPYTVYEHFRDVPDLGKTNSGSRSYAPDYTLIDKSIDLKVQYDHLMKNGPYAEIRATLHEEAISFRPAGEYLEDGIMMGEIKTEMSSKESERIVRAFRYAMSKLFPAKAYKRYWIGPEALVRLKQGARLCNFYDHPNSELLDIKLSGVEYVIKKNDSTNSKVKVLK